MYSSGGRRWRTVRRHISTGVSHARQSLVGWHHSQVRSQQEYLMRGSHSSVGTTQRCGHNRSISCEAVTRRLAPLRGAVTTGVSHARQSLVGWHHSQVRSQHLGNSVDSAIRICNHRPMGITFGMTITRYRKWAIAFSGGWVDGWVGGWSGIILPLFYRIRWYMAPQSGADAFHFALSVGPASQGLDKLRDGKRPDWDQQSNITNNILVLRIYSLRIYY
jgi:hypothetical protein